MILPEGYDAGVKRALHLRDVAGRVVQGASGVARDIDAGMSRR
ncbi:hypothetical protein [Mesobacterium pallidum]|nr:hypothetical protein [Mesobacterium pallidum]